MTPIVSFLTDRSAITRIQATIIIAIIVIAAGAGVAWYLMAPKAGGTIKIGLSVPLSPPGFFTSGRNMEKAGRMIVDDINKAGGVLGRQLELVVYDDKGTVDDGVAVARRLAQQDKVIAVIGGYHSSPWLAQQPIFHEYGVIGFGHGWSDLFQSTRMPEFFRISPWVSEQAGRFLEGVAFVAQSQGIQDRKARLAIIAETSDYGVGSEKEIRNLIQQRNLPFEVTSQFVEPESKDLTPQLLKIKDYNPDILINIVAFTPGVFLVVRQAGELGICPPCTILVPQEAPRYPDFWQIAGSYGVGVAGFVDSHISITMRTELGRNYVNEFKQKYNEDPLLDAIIMYDEFRILVDAIKRAGTTDHDPLIKALEQTKMPSIYALGDITFSTEPTGPVYHQFTEQSFTLVQYTAVNQQWDDAKLLWTYSPSA